MTVLSGILIAISCVVGGTNVPICMSLPQDYALVSEPDSQPTRSENALDVYVTAQAAVAWDVASGATLYEKNAAIRRPVASLTKLLSVLTVRDILSPASTVEISASAGAVQRFGAHIRLPVGSHATVQDLLAASLIASANDAIVALAEATAGSEEVFVVQANAKARQLGLFDTHVANATGLTGGDQYSTARDVRQLLTLVNADSLLGLYLNDNKGRLVTREGAVREYDSTNELLSTYLPILAAKTGYTIEAGENVALLTQVAGGQTIGIIILGSEQRFQDAKILAEWIHRHYTWPR